MPSMLFTSRQLPNRDGETIAFLKLCGQWLALVTQTKFVYTSTRQTSDDAQFYQSGNATRTV